MSQDPARYELPEPAPLAFIVAASVVLWIATLVLVLMILHAL